LKALIYKITYLQKKKKKANPKVVKIVECYKAGEDEVHMHEKEKKLSLINKDSSSRICASVKNLDKNFM
jgi:hypothetical protein